MSIRSGEKKLSVFLPAVGLEWGRRFLPVLLAPFLEARNAHGADAHDAARRLAKYLVTRTRRKLSVRQAQRFAVYARRIPGGRALGRAIPSRERPGQRIHSSGRKCS